MTSEKTNSSSKTVAKFLVGCSVIVVGTTLTLLWFDDMMVMIRGSVGVLFSVGGMLLLYSLKK